MGDDQHRIWVCGFPFDALTVERAAELLLTKVEAGVGGRAATPNVDCLRLASSDPYVANRLLNADILLADGMPVVWASKLQGNALPGRAPGSTFMTEIAAAAARHERKVFLLGAAPGVSRQAGEFLSSQYPGLRIAGTYSPPYGFLANEKERQAVVNAATAAQADIVLVALPFVLTEQTIDLLQTHDPRAWYIGVGAGFDFVGGRKVRAPHWVQRLGFEWLWRLAQEPRRLGRRYLIHDFPFAINFLWQAFRSRGKVQTVTTSPAE